MIIKKFIAPTMPEALAKVKHDLGDQAVILKTRMNKRGGPDGGKSVEITAAIEREQKQRVNVMESPIQSENLANRLREFEESDKQPAGELPSEKLENLIKEIAEFKKALQDNSDKNKPKSFFGNFSSAMLDAGRELVSRNFPEDIAYAVVSRLAKSENSLGFDEAEIKNRVQQTLSAMIPAGEPIALKPSGPTVVMLVGMTGSGKTSAVARIATQFKVEHNTKVAIITTDNFRADSTQQIKSFCRILGCPCGIVYTPEELSMAIKSQSDGLILIDTPGVNPNDDKELGELSAFIRSAKLHELHLTVAASTPARDVKKMIGAFEEFGIDKILITKLDETEACGGVIGAVIEKKKKFSYISNSREIPGLFKTAAPEILADALIAENRIVENEPQWEMETVGIWQ